MTNTTTTPVQITAVEMKANGATYVAIGKALGVSDKTAKRYVEQGEFLLAEQAKAKTAKANGNRSGGTRKAYDKATMQKVVRMREQDEASWATIAEALELNTPGKARRVYRNAKSIQRGLPLGRFEKGGRLADHNPYAPEACQVGIVSEADRLANERIIAARLDQA